MPWVILLASAVCEAIWATALGQSQGFTRLWPTIVFLAFLVISMIGLSHALADIPIGTAYAVWTGVGAALTVAWAMATGTETVSLMKVVFLTGIIAAVIGLKLAPGPGSRPAAPDSPAQSTET